ncbi:MAG: hypothetical protein ABJQ39_02890 [Winogradskyella arenosi]
MKKFIKHIILFSIPMFGVLCALEVLFRSVPNNYSYKNELLNTKYEGVILGNSHAYRGLLAENLQYNSINLSNVSQSIDIDYEWFQKVILQKDLTFVIVNVSFPTVLKTLKESKEKWRIKYYNIYTDLQLDYKINNNLEIVSSNSDEKIKKISDYFFNSNLIQFTCLKKGSYPLNVTFHDFKKKASITTKRHFDEGLKYFDKNIETLKLIINKANTENIKVILVTPPMHEEYRALVDKRYSDKLFNTLKVIENMDGVEYLNFYSDMAFDDSMYKDADHLNLKGASIFTKMINDKLTETLYVK